MRSKRLQNRAYLSSRCRRGAAASIDGRVGSPALPPVRRLALSPIVCQAATSARRGSMAGGAMREIEVKYLLQDSKALLAALKTRGIEPGEPACQDDQAYAPHGWQFGESKLGVSFVRLSMVYGRHFFALKQPVTNAQSCLEYETEVADRQAMHEAILQMGFYATVRVVKTRRTAIVGPLALCVDDLEGVGTFLELERMVPDDVSAEDVQAKLA